MTKAAVGLTLAEAENAFARAMVNDGALSSPDVDVILEEKRQTIRKSGVLERSRFGGSNAERIQGAFDAAVTETWSLSCRCSTRTSSGEG